MCDEVIQYKAKTAAAAAALSVGAERAEKTDDPPVSI